MRVVHVLRVIATLAHPARAQVWDSIQTALSLLNFGSCSTGPTLSTNGTTPCGIARADVHCRFIVVALERVHT